MPKPIDLNDPNECDWTFEDAFQELEATVERLETGNLTLEQSLEMYEWARELVAWCQKRLDKAELRVQQLSEAGEVAPLE